MKIPAGLDLKGVLLPEPTCQNCQKVCEVSEVVYTGDEESWNGYEVWNYCSECDMETNHLIPQITETDLKRLFGDE